MKCCSAPSRTRLCAVPLGSGGRLIGQAQSCDRAHDRRNGARRQSRNRTPREQGRRQRSVRRRADFAAEQFLTTKASGRFVHSRPIARSIFAQVGLSASRDGSRYLSMHIRVGNRILVQLAIDFKIELFHNRAFHRDRNTSTSRKQRDRSDGAPSRSWTPASKAL